MCARCASPSGPPTGDCAIPIFIGMRTDRKPEEVQREAGAESDAALEVDETAAAKASSPTDGATGTPVVPAHSGAC